MKNTITFIFGLLMFLLTTLTWYGLATLNKSFDSMDIMFACSILITGYFVSVMCVVISFDKGY